MIIATCLKDKSSRLIHDRLHTVQLKRQIAGQRSVSKVKLHQNELRRETERQTARLNAVQRVTVSGCRINVRQSVTTAVRKGETSSASCFRTDVGTGSAAHAALVC